MRKFFSLIASLVLAAGLLGAFAGTALADSPDAWHKSCNTQSTANNNPTLYFAKESVDLGTTIEAVRGTVHIGSNVTAYPCVPNGGATGNTYIWATNLQSDDGLVQWGLCRLSSTGTWKMCYTLWDDTFGAGIVYAPEGAQLPIYAGHDYYFQITGCTTTLGAWKWCLYVDDLDALTGDPTLKIDRTWDFNDGKTAWWGFEAQDADGAIGYRYGTTDTKHYVYNMMYKRHDNNTWVYRQQSSCYVIRNVGTRAPYFQCATDNTTYTNDTIRVFTAAQN